MPEFSRGGDASDLKDWLAGLDEQGNLLPYHDAIVARCGSLAELLVRYAPEGALDACFFEDCGVRKVGHRRIFERGVGTGRAAAALEAKPVPAAALNLTGVSPHPAAALEAPPVPAAVLELREVLRDPVAQDEAEDLPIELVEAFYRDPGRRLCEVAEAGDVRGLAVFVALCGHLGLAWHELRREDGVSVAEAAGDAGHVDLAGALVLHGVRRPLAAVVRYGYHSVAEVEAMVRGGLEADVHACAAACLLPDAARRAALLAVLSDAERAAGWLQKALGGSSREWIAALRVARAYGVELRV